tara:strand:+ start:265 stop:516 length:252 start_codon:yes stop_codon:yes gene_type:complete
MISVISCSNVKQGSFTSGTILKDTNPAKGLEIIEDDAVEEIKYQPLPEWTQYDINPSSVNYKKIYGISKFKDKRIVLAFQQVP